MYLIIKITIQTLRNSLYFLVICCLLLFESCGNQKFEKDQSTEPTAKTKSSKYKILMDVGHNQVFWNDPENMEGKPQNLIERVKYMTDQIMQTATSVDAGVGYLKEEINPDHLTRCDLLFIHMPKSKYTPDEINAIFQFVKRGGSLFLVMDVDYWSSLEQTNVNDLIKQFDIKYGGQSPDTITGGYTKAGIITDAPLKISYHDGRMIHGGTPFCFNNQTDPFGTFKNVVDGGKIIVMRDGMTSLYMTSWQGVEDYQCQDFMQAAFKWLLE